MTSLGYLGEIRNLHCNENKHCIEWMIPKVLWQPKNIGNFFSSPFITILDKKLQFRIYPFGDLTKTEWILLEYIVPAFKRITHISFTVTQRGSFEEQIFYDGTVSDRPDKIAVLRISDALETPFQWYVLDSLIITCRMWTDEPSFNQAERITNCGRQMDPLSCDDAVARKNSERHDTRGRDILEKQFKDLLLQGKDHDVILKVKDRQFRVHKCILRARSPVFDAMFAHKMKESISGEVTIEDCDPEAFGDFLQYVYTGKVENLTPSSALNMYYVSEKYEFPDLKETCVHFLKESLSTNVICEVISLAMQYGEEELKDCAMSFFTTHLPEILMSVEWQRFLARNPTQANEFNIKAMKSYKKIG